jgi:hypothetical protein
VFAFFYSIQIPVLFFLFDICSVSYFQVIMNFVYLAIGSGLASTLRKWNSYSKLIYHIHLWTQILFTAN